MKKHTGFSLLELLISMLLSLFLLGGLITLILLGSKSQGAQNQQSRLHENVRYGIEMLLRDLRMAGYFGCASDPNKVRNQADHPAGALSDVHFALEGREQAHTAWSPSGSSEKIDEMAQNTDAISIRFANASASAAIRNTMPSAESAIPRPDNTDWRIGDLLVISDCDGAEVFQATAVDSNWVVPNKLSRAYATGSELTSLWAARYFIAPSTTNGLPTLKRQLLQGGGHSTTEELAQGVENLQFLYGEDQDADGFPDVYRQAHQVTHWPHIVTIQVGLLLRSLEEFGTEQDTAVHQVLDHGFDDPDDLRLTRKVVNYTVALRNSAF